MTTGLSDFLKYNLWANLRLLEACSQLTYEKLDFTTQGVYGSIRETIVHIFASEERYARDCSPTYTVPTSLLDELDVFAGFEVLRQRITDAGTHLIEVAEHANPAEILHLPEDYVAPLIIVLIQAVNHGVDHRSQIATMLSLQGIKPPRIDGWGYNNDLK
jgi:uncharacterized damage-inducible protein DinB